ncbi:ribosome biogenesis GTPase YlqF [Shuttleworthella satelles]|uniref:Ribosome biogenesis GTPase A n=1 Tax=Shuttleworthella satelles DSM 14600 TaxID=626523 RepID=C4GAZ8_9FIRM|nr:ribosome biogenesis GTPase YlqF [Shuttleworthia satelles]EEP28291.1 ribosome biogenesis GTP-binding protein YlqF [Shuttleworthia satelles DSM 14600]
MNIQWFPGHMTKAKRQMQEDIKLIDLVIELLDARIPLASRNPEIDQLARDKARMILLNKADLSDPKMTSRWKEYFERQGMTVLALDSRSASLRKPMQKAIMDATEKKRARDLRRGIKNRPVRAMIAGIPNVGKSTLINSLAGRAAARTGNKPGVTKGKQWIHLRDNIDLLDTPGILWPKFEDQETGIHLAMIGAISDHVLQVEDLSLKVIHFLREAYPGVLSDRYAVDEEKEDVDILSAIALKRGCLVRGNEIDYRKTADLFLDEFRKGQLGRISIEMTAE